VSSRLTYTGERAVIAARVIMLGGVGALSARRRVAALDLRLAAEGDLLV